MLNKGAPWRHLVRAICWHRASKVGEQHPQRRTHEQDIIGLDVAMDPTLGVDVCNRLEERSHHGWRTCRHDAEATGPALVLVERHLGEGEAEVMLPHGSVD